MLAVEVFFVPPSVLEGVLTNKDYIEVLEYVRLRDHKPTEAEALQDYLENLAEESSDG
jgi:hypothetical protein